jgi:biopolymer transport protein ExbD
MLKTGLKRIFAERKSSFTLRMAPMIDMIFLLLIFFLVAAKWRPEEKFLPFQLPSAQADSNIIGRPEPLLIHISATQKGCQVRIGRLQTVQIEDEKIEMSLAILMEEIRDCLIEQQRIRTDPIEITCEPDVKWDHLAKISNVFSGAGVDDITFTMTERLPENVKSEPEY